MLSAKAVAVVLVVVALTAVALAALALALLPSSLLHGSAAGTTSRWWQSLFGAVLRALAMTAIATVIGFSIAAIGRNTAAALGALFGYVIVVERVVAAFIPGAIRWLIIGNAVVFVSGQTNDAARGQTVLGAGLYLGTFAVVLFILALIVFQRRDVA